MTVNTIPRPKDVPVRLPVDHIGIGTMWAYLGLPRGVAVEWAKEDFDPHGALRVIAAYDEASFDIMEAALDG